MHSEIEPRLLGAGEYTAAEAAALAGAPLDRARRLWVAFGFPVGADESARMFTAADVSALHTLNGLVADEILDDASELAIARSLGQAMSRLAEWQVDLIAAAAARRLGPDPTLAESVAKASAVGEKVGPALQDLQIYAWRRQLAVAAARMLANSDSGGDERVLAVGFADLVGYTALTRQLTDRQLNRMLDTFEAVTADAIGRGAGWVIKNVGDEVMFACNGADDAATIAIRLHEQIEQRPDELPTVRIGIARGPVLARYGDLFGTVVNLASRLTGLARPGTTLVDVEAAGELDGHPDFWLRSLKPIRVRGFRAVRAHVLRVNGRK